MKKKLDILFIDDDLIEGMKFNRALNGMDYDCNIIEASNGEDALNILRQKQSLPNIILLDLNMPKLNGIEFLKILKEDDLIKQIPTIVFTTSNHRKDILECYKIGIAGYIIKPLKYEDYKEIVKKTLDYWAVNELV